LHEIREEEAILLLLHDHPAQTPASPTPCQLVEQIRAGSFLDGLPARLIGNKSYNSGKRDEKSAEEYGTELLVPNRRK